MAFSKITLNGTTLMDVTQDTVEEETLLSGETATKANGLRTTGTLTPDGIPYSGTDLTEKFASEISAASGNPWAWIKSRITNGDYSGLRIGDYIPFVCTDQSETELTAVIIGVNTYKRSGDNGNVVGNHIDFWAGMWPTAHAINKANYNNGTSVSSHPWLASDGYMFANSLSGQVPSSAAANPDMTAVDYTSGGIYYYLPTNLKNVIAEKRVLLETRYTAGSLLTNAGGRAWANLGKIWFPHEIEVYGMPCYSASGNASCGFVQYPFFAENMNRLRFGRSYGWWIISPMSGNSTQWCYVQYHGAAFFGNASISTLYCPICFRIA